MLLAMNWRERWCVLFHRNMEVVSKLGHSWHIRCHKCGCEYGINHDVRVVLPWRDVKPLHDELETMIEQAKAVSR